MLQGGRVRWNRTLAGLWGIIMMACVASRDGTPASVAPVAAFDPAGFVEPEAVLWPGAFWLWNAPLEPETLRAQLRDMASHGLRSVCMLPMPHAFRPDSTNNSLDPDYLTPEFFDRVRLAVDEAAKLKMNWWLYDEGGWPSGQALGQVKAGHPEFGQHRLVRERIEAKEPFTVPQDAFALVVEGPTPKTLSPGETWSPESETAVAYVYRASVGGYADLLNPDATKRFLELTHEGYKRAIGRHFGKTVKFTFTDEPNAPNLDPPKSITGTPGMDALYTQRFGGRLCDVLPLLFTPPGPDAPADVARARIDFYDLWTSRFRDAYFRPIQDWCHKAGLGSSGHLNGEDETINAVKYGFGQALRQLRAMDVPGVDLIWRQLFPGRPNQHFFPKYASSAAHQNGTRFAFSESFCVYGNGLTPAQMKWLVDYQYARGINLLVVGCFPLSTRDHHMTGERPHFGPVDPMWDHLCGFNAYVARLGYALSVGKPKISTALYYPARDMWALGLAAKEAAETHDQLAQELFAHQCDFDLIDDDLLTDPATHVENGELAAGAMRYSTIVCGAVRWMHPDALAMLKRLAENGGRVLCLNNPPGTDGSPGPPCEQFQTLAAAALAPLGKPPTAQLLPESRDIRVAARTMTNGEILFLFNEGNEHYRGIVLRSRARARRLDLFTGRTSEVRLAEASDDAYHLDVDLQPGESALYLFSEGAPKASHDRTATESVIGLDSLLKAEPRRRFIVGDHDFEVIAPAKDSSSWGKYKGTPATFEESAVWKTWLGEDFSGEVDYRAEFELPRKTTLVLETGAIEYAATVFLDGKEVGHLLWPPWQLQLPPCKPGKHEILIRVANTLANELTSERVTKLWAEKKGPGWPSPYHKRALEFERESRGGGIHGPICLVKYP